MKVRIYKDEISPVYGIDTDLAGEYELIIEVDKRLYRQFLKNEKKFWELQDKLEELYIKAKKEKESEKK